MKKYSNYKIDNRNPHEKKKHVKDMFDSIAPTYDFLNRFLSLGIDSSWRKKLVKLCGRIDDKLILDLCCGTGDLTHEFIKRKGNVVSLDFSLGMIRKGRERGWLGGLNVSADASRIPLKKNTFHSVTIAFGIRNIPDIDMFLKDVFRVLTPGGELFILELTRPKNRFVKFFYDLYLKKILPAVGGLFSGKKEAYSYLAETISTFLEPSELIQRIHEAGFSKVESVRLTMGVATIYVCKKI